MLTPSVDRYLATLPNGLASYPECCVKASVLRNTLGSKPLGPDVELPLALRRLVDHPPPLTEWIPEVHFNAVSLAIREVHFNPRSLDDYLAWTFEQNRKLLSTPLYRVLFLLLTPERLLSGMQNRWSAFRRGTELQIVSRAAGRVELRLRHPAFLYPALSSQGMSAAFQAAMEHAGAKQARVEVASPGSTETTFLATWH
jgi:hypothetical protein